MSRPSLVIPPRESWHLAARPLPRTADLPPTRPWQGEITGIMGEMKANTECAHCFTISLHPSFAATLLSLGASEHFLSVREAVQPCEREIGEREKSVWCLRKCNCNLDDLVSAQHRSSAVSWSTANASFQDLRPRETILVTQAGLWGIYSNLSSAPSPPPKKLEYKIFSFVN